MSSGDAFGRYPIIVMLRNQVDLAALDADIVRAGKGRTERASLVVAELQSLAARSQATISVALDNWQNTGAVSRVRSHWLINAISLTATPSAIAILARRSDVEHVFYDGVLVRDEPIDDGPAQRVPGGAEDGLRAVKADEMWRLGYTGNGVIVMNIDSGVDVTHPALAGTWYGWEGGPASEAWFDPIRGLCGTPCDYEEHGSHTMGIMVGLEAATADTIGVAWGARWIAAATIDVGAGVAHTSYSIAALEWAIDPTPGASVRPPAHVVNCSWWDPDLPEGDDCAGGAGTYWAAIDAYEATGGAVVFSAGNGGPYPSSITPPKNRNASPVNVFATGNINPHDPEFPIMWSSSRGPSDCDEAVIKPEVVAPGGGIRSAIPGNYWSKTGTSMAAPHVSGVIALLMEAFPWATGTEIKLALLATAQDLGDPGEDNTYGHGLVDAVAAYEFLGGAVDVRDEVYGDSPSASLSPSSPNPFNPSTTIGYDLSTPMRVSLRVFNARGQLVSELVRGEVRDAGPYLETWSGRTVDGELAAPGMYFFRLDARAIDGDESDLRVRRAVLVR